MSSLIIFDMDGTLLYTLDDLHKAVNTALTEYGYQIKTIDEIQNFVGNGVVKLIERALPSGMENPDFKKVFTRFIQAYEEQADGLTRPYEGIVTLLNDLKQKGYSLAVNSNKYDSAVQSLCKKYFPQVDIALGARDGYDVKPSPQGVFTIINSFNKDFKQIYFVGDSDVDVMTARNAKIKSIGVTWGYRSRESLVSAGADFIINEPKEIFLVLGD